MARTPMKDVLDKVQDLWRQARGGAYFVHRGAVHWPTFDFDARPRAVGIGVDDRTLMREINDMDLSFEVGARMPEGAELQFDDSLATEIQEDVEWVIRKLIESTNPEGDSLILNPKLGDARVIEWSDPDFRAQGVVVFLTISH